MLGSIFIGLSGMKAFSNGLKQISNNITNINSQGFKAADLTFRDLFSNAGAHNGQGVAVNETRTDFAQGELRTSDRDLDLAVDGRGFLVLTKDDQHYFARTGSFEVNKDGDIVLAGADYKLTILDASGKPSAVSIEALRTNAPKATSTITFADNLSSTATSFNVPSLQISNSEGESETWAVKFERATTAPAGEWTVIVTKDAGATEVGRKTLKFISGIVDPSTNKLEFVSGGRAVTFDFSRNVTSFSSGEVSTLRVSDNDGHGSGEISTIKVNEAGKLEIAYSNEEKVELGAITIASFEDEQRLTQRGGGIFALETEQGVEFLNSAHEKVGRVLSSRLEASNVDLSREFGDLILVQRGFQASSQIVSVSNEMIQQLFGVRGQG